MDPTKATPSEQALLIVDALYIIELIQNIQLPDLSNFEQSAVNALAKREVRQLPICILQSQKQCSISQVVEEHVQSVEQRVQDLEQA